jgi:hypothetical protein
MDTWLTPAPNVQDETIIGMCLHIFWKTRLEIIAAPNKSRMKRQNNLTRWLWAQGDIFCGI